MITGMSRNYRIIILLAAVLLPFSAAAEILYSDGESGSVPGVAKGMEIKNVDGLRLAVPKDMPVEKRGSVVVPMSMEEYVAMKFSELEERISKMEESLKNINKELASIKENAPSHQEPLSVLADPKKSNAPASRAQE